MKYFFELVGINKEIGKLEILSLLKIKHNHLVDNLFLIDTEDDIDFLRLRLAFSHNCWEFIFGCKLKDLNETINKVDWETIISGSYKVVNSGNLNLKSISDLVYNSISNPEVDVKYPENVISFFEVDGEVFCGKFLFKVDKSFQNRRSHLRPKNSPTSLSPRLAKAAINITGIMKGETFCDPFCGTGGILIEGRLMKLKCIGYDFDNISVEKSKINLTYFNVKCRVEVKDALKLDRSFDYIVTDLPYGQNTKVSMDIYKLYESFIDVATSKLIKKMTIMLPDEYDPKPAFKRNNLKLLFETEYYIHKSKTKKIYLVSK